MDGRSNESVYQAHAVELVRFATGLVGVDDAPDVVADAFLRVTRSPVWAEARDRRVIWLRAVVYESRSVVRTTVRRRERERRVAVPAMVEDREHPAADPGVADALELLSAQQRAVVMLTYWMDLTPAATAELLEISEGSVRKQLARARARLKEALS